MDIRWEKSLNNNNWTEVAGQMSATFQPSNLTETTYFRRKVTSGSLVRYSNVVLITVREQVTAPIISGGGTFCKGSDITMNITNSAFGLTYEWYNQAQTFVQNGLTLFENDIQETKKFYARGKNEVNCYSAFGEVNLIVDPINANFTQSHSNIVEGGQVQFYSTSTNASSFEWNFGIGEIYTEQNPYVYYNQPGVYATNLKVWSTLGCTSEKLVSGSVTVSPYNSVDENPVSVSLFPNPTDGVVSIVSELGIEAVEVYSLLGVKQVFKAYSAENQISINLRESLAKGVYVVKVFGKGHVANFKVILQ